MTINLSPQKLIDPVLFGFCFAFGFALGNWIIGLVPWPM